MEILLALGANLPGPDGTPPDATLRAAFDRLSDRLETPLKVSRLFRTPCFPAGSGPDYVNAAARAECDLTPEVILDRCHGIEAEFGRAREQRWGQRTLDIDLIAVGNQIAPDRATFGRWHRLSPGAQRTMAPDELILPHPRLQDRAFVLVPMAEVAPNWQHPVLGLTVAQMAAAPDPTQLTEIVPLTD